jgi:hypothetical protein
MGVDSAGHWAEADGFRDVLFPEIVRGFTGQAVWIAPSRFTIRAKPFSVPYTGFSALNIY